MNLRYICVDNSVCLSCLTCMYGKREELWGWGEGGGKDTESKGEDEFLKKKSFILTASIRLSDKNKLKDDSLY